MINTLTWIIIAIIGAACGKTVKERGTMHSAKLADDMGREADQIGVIAKNDDKDPPQPDPVAQEESAKDACERHGLKWEHDICVRELEGGMEVKNLPPYFTSTPIVEHSFYTNAGESITLAAKVRDFKKSHVDFEKFSGTSATKGLVHSTLGNDGNPIFIGSPGLMITSSQSFSEWYNDVPGVNLSKVIELKLTKKAGTPHIYMLDNPEFFPIDNDLHGNEALPHNYHFTMRVETIFTYLGGEIFTFTGDDDVWVFINHKLAVDLGGVHHRDSETVALDSLGLVKGKDYPFVMFFAERHTDQSRFRVETSVQLRSNAAYQYDAKAVDPEGTNISYALVSGPPGMSIHPSNGTILWPPDKLVVGSHPVVIKASDAAGSEALQQFVVNLTPGT